MVIVGQHLGQEVDLQILRRGSVRHQPSLVPRPEDDAVFRKDLSGGDPTSGADDAAVAQLSRSTNMRLVNEKRWESEDYGQSNERLTSLYLLVFHESKFNPLKLILTFKGLVLQLTSTRELNATTLLTTRDIKQLILTIIQACLSLIALVQGRFLLINRRGAFKPIVFGTRQPLSSIHALYISSRLSSYSTLKSTYQSDFKLSFAE